MDYSLHLYGEVRQHLREAMQDCAAAGKRVAIYGRGEAAELAYLSLKESGLEPVAIFDARRRPRLPRHAGAADRRARIGRIRPDDRRDARRSGQHVADLLRDGVPREKLFPLRKDPEPAPKRARSAPVRVRARPTASTSA